MNERWAQVGDTNYEVSDDGQVRSCRGILKARVVRGKKVVLIGAVSSTNSVHRLVASAFIPNPEQFKWVCFKDGDKFNCHWTNLEWRPRRVSHDRICKRCGEMRPLKHFKLIGPDKIYRKHTCTPCLSKKDTVRRKMKILNKMFKR